MTIEPFDLRTRVRALLELQGAVLTDNELTQVSERYPHCGGTERWDVREYARRTGLGGREYRVVRGTSSGDVYCSVERGSAAALQTALNELESQERTREESRGRKPSS